MDSIAQDKAIYNSFSYWLKAHRESAGYSSEDLVRLVGHTHIDMARLEADDAPLHRLKGRYKEAFVRRVAKAVGGSESEALRVAGVAIQEIAYVMPPDEEILIHSYGQGWGYLSGEQLEGHNAIVEVIRKDRHSGVMGRRPDDDPEAIDHHHEEDDDVEPITTTMDPSVYLPPDVKRKIRALFHEDDEEEARGTIGHRSKAASD